VTPGAFQILSEGRTLHFSLDGVPFGAEQYLPGRRTLWRFEGGPCVAGAWRAEGEAICFRYDGQVAPSCWRLVEERGRLVARLLEGGAETGFALTLERSETEPLACKERDLIG
jgi:hypothetical protein